MKDNGLDRKKLSEELSAFLREESSDSKEAAFIRDMNNRVLEEKRLEPPAHLFTRIKSQIEKQKGGYNLSSQIVSLFTRPVFALPAVAVFLLALTFYLPLFNRTAEIQLTRLQTEYTPITEATVINGTGLRITAEAGTVMKHDPEASGDFFISKGRIKVETDHKRLAPRTWFHFKGGGITPVGTEFIISMSESQSRIELLEGELRYYRKNNNGQLTGGSLKTPGRLTFSNAEILNFSEVKERRQFNTIRDNGETVPGAPDAPDRKEKKPAEKNSPSAGQQSTPVKKYSEYFGRQITVIMKNGDRLSGTAVDFRSSELVIQTDGGILHLPDSGVSEVK